MNTSMVQRIISLMGPVAEGLTVADVRIGLVYTSVRLDNDEAGVAWTGHRQSDGCIHLGKAGTLAGRPAGELLEMLAARDDPVYRTIGLATANALAAGMPAPESVSTEILELIDVQPSEHVVMAGYFGPLVPRLHEIGCRLDIMELKKDRPGTLSPDQGRAALEACDVAIITATSIITDTIDELLAGLGDIRAAIMLGPSSFMRPEVYAGTSLTHIAGGWVRDVSAAQRIVSEGGGTKTLRRHMEFETLCLGG